jgi:hypothetical protein
MNKILAGVLAVTAIATCAGTAKAESQTCVWTRQAIWECSDNNVVTHYYALPAGPNTAIRTVPTPTPVAGPYDAVR